MLGNSEFEVAELMLPLNDCWSNLYIAWVKSPLVHVSQIKNDGQIRALSKHEHWQSVRLLFIRITLGG